MPEFDCITCGTKLKAADSQAGKFVRCPRCKTTMRVPTPGGIPAAPPPLAATPVFAAGAGARRYGFNCQYCSSRLEATTAMAGQEGHCPTCGNTIIIPILDRYGRLIDPMTGKVIKQDPHPVHAYAAAGERAPKILRDDGGRQYIGCPRCGTVNAISANNCKNCGMPFTMEGTTLEAAGASNGFATASLVLGIVGLPTFCLFVPSLLAVIFGIIGLQQTSGGSAESGGRGLAIGGLVCGGIGLMMGMFVYLL
jgi:DNA-directed RNA polymerase subunit RPC12/RpoP